MMTNKPNMTAREMADYLLAHDRFLVLTHRRPDGDTVGSAAALLHGLRSLGKEAYCLQNPDLTHRYGQYVEAFYAPEGYEPGCIVAVDIAAPGLLTENAGVYAGRIDACIDHHGTNEEFAANICVHPECAANGELIYQILCLMGAEITPEMADVLYIAISTDTGAFCYSNTSAQTHRIVADLIDRGCHMAQLNKKLFETMSRASANLKGAVYGGMQYYAGGAVALAAVTNEVIAKAGARDDDMEAVSAWARRVKGVVIGLTLTERPEGIKVSVRTEAPVDAARIAREFGGGGHPRAAGCTIPGTMEEACKALLGAVMRLEEELAWTSEEREALSL